MTVNEGRMRRVRWDGQLEEVTWQGEGGPVQVTQAIVRDDVAQSVLWSGDSNVNRAQLQRGLGIHFSQSKKKITWCRTSPPVCLLPASGELLLELRSFLWGKL